MQFDKLLVVSSTVNVQARTLLRTVDRYPRNPYTHNNPEYGIFYSNIFSYMSYA